MTCIRQKRANEHYHNIFQDLPTIISSKTFFLTPNTISQKDKKSNTTGLDDTTILHIKIKVTEMSLKKKAQYSNTLNPHVSLFLLFFSLGGEIRVKMEKPSSVIHININISYFCCCEQIAEIYSQLEDCIFLMSQNYKCFNWK